MAWLFGLGRTNQTIKPSAALRVQTALQGQPIAILLGGQNRLGVNLIDYTDFRALPQSSGGGKGIGGGGGKGTSATSYNYQAAIIAAICEGPVASIDAVWNNKTKQTLASLNLTAFLGTYAQTAWGYMTSAHPDRARAYRGLAYVAAGPLALGNVPELPNLNLEVTAINANAITGAPDADPSDCVISFLTDANFGLGFPAALIDALTDYSDYCIASGMVVSPVISGQVAASSFFADFLAATNSEARWSSGLLSIIPYGDENIAANGAVFIAVTSPEYDLDDDAYVAQPGQDAILITRKAQTDQLNLIAVEYLNRKASPDAAGNSLAYDPAVVEAKDEGDILLNGLRAGDKKSYHFFCLSSAAQQSADLLLGRQQIRNEYAFTLLPKFILLDPMDIVTLTDSALGLNRKPVRIKSIDENTDGSLVVIAEDYLIGSASAPVYGPQANSGNVPDYNVAPGNINTPTIFEPTDELAGGLQIWLPVSGASPDVWGGCYAYISTDGDTYQLVGKIEGAARTGKLTAVLAAVLANPSGGQTIDTTNTLSVSLIESEGTLVSGSQADALALNTACYIAGEIIAYQTATLTGSNTYDLTYLVRGAYGTEVNIAAHAINTPFVRLDDSILKLPFTQDRIGQTIYFKFASFNIYGGDQQSLADVGQIAYIIQGTALASPLPDVTNFRTTYIDATSSLMWEEIVDFRPVRYELRKGDDWASALVIGNVAHPPFTTFGDGTYWIAGISQPIAGLSVYSETPVSLTILGSILTSNVVASYDEVALGWLGYVSGFGTIDGGVFYTTSFNSITHYEIPESHWFNVAYSRPTRLNASWKATGSIIGSNILDIGDFLGEADILGSSAARYVESWVEVATSLTASATDIFSGIADIFVPADIFSGDLIWGEWVRFAPGVYVGKWFKFRLAIESLLVSVQAAATAFAVEADVDDRNDHLTNYSLAAGGETFSFTPDGLGSPVGFNGGPDGAVVPNIQVTILSATAGDDVLITGTTLSQTTIQIKNGGVGVARSINAVFQGW